MLSLERERETIVMFNKKNRAISKRQYQKDKIKKKQS